MAGYNGKKMSWNAVDAYEAGEMPASKWTKKAMLEAINEWLWDESRRLNENVSDWKKERIFKELFKWSSWHHTGKFYRETDFYCIDSYALTEISSPVEIDDTEYEAAREARWAAGERKYEAEQARWQYVDSREAEVGNSYGSLKWLYDIHPELFETRISLRGTFMIKEIRTGKEVALDQAWRSDCEAELYDPQLADLTEKVTAAWRARWAAEQAVKDEKEKIWQWLMRKAD